MKVGVEVKFKSKSDLWIGLLVWIPITFFTGYSFLKESLTIKIIMISTFIFLAWLWLGTDYYITGTMLRIKSGPFSEDIPIKDILSIRSTRNAISSPALSLDRLQIRYGYGKVVLISPTNKESFIEKIVEKNSDIAINIK